MVYSVSRAAIASKAIGAPNPSNSQAHTESVCCHGGKVNNKAMLSLCNRYAMAMLSHRCTAQPLGSALHSAVHFCF